MSVTEATKGNDLFSPYVFGSHNVPTMHIYDMLTSQARHRPQAIAILAPDRPALTYAQLLQQADKTAKDLIAHGVSRDDRVAVVAPNGLDTAVAFLAIASAATCAPLNPGLSAREMDSYLADLEPSSVIVPTDLDSPVRDIAHARGITCIELLPQVEEAGDVFTLTGEKTKPATARTARAEDIALVLPTSGTTGRSKIVQLTHANACAGPYTTCLALTLTCHDRCLNPMPLFHSHGLLAGLLAPLISGGSIVCLPRFDESQFFDWIEEFLPTWFTAVPTMYQAILRCSETMQETIKQCPVRFIRSASVPLRPQLMMDLERVFNAPVTDSYGLAEAPQLTNLPLPPQKRKIGSVGLAARGVELIILDQAGDEVPSGTVGEIAVRAPHVMPGYADNSYANERVFVNGWLRTGDQGWLDEEGFLFFDARLDEVINRGGEKISPSEVDKVFLSHPAVRDAAAFPVPHPTLGQDIAAVVVLREKRLAQSEDLRKFARTQLAEFKVPKRVFIVEEIPKSATGKLQRFRLAQSYGPKLHERAQRKNATVPCTPVEKLLVDICREILRVEQLDSNDNLMQLGLDSLSAMQIASRINIRLNVGFSIVDVFETPTISRLASVIVERRNNTDPRLCSPE